MQLLNILHKMKMYTQTQVKKNPNTEISIVQLFLNILCLCSKMSIVFP